MHLLITHGAGSNRNAPLLVAIDKLLKDSGIGVTRIDLPFRQKHSGPPRPGDAGEDRAGLRDEILRIRKVTSEPVILGGASYGGRQASILASEEAALADGLLLLSYPLHPPGKPGQLRTAHLPGLRVPVLFVHGSRDPFGTIEEIEAAIRLIPSRTRLVPVERAGHDLKGAAPAVASAFQEFFTSKAD